MADWLLTYHSPSLVEKLQGILSLFLNKPAKTFIDGWLVIDTSFPSLVEKLQGIISLFLNKPAKTYFDGWLVIDTSFPVIDRETITW